MSPSTASTLSLVANSNLDRDLNMQSLAISSSSRLMLYLPGGTRPNSSSHHVWYINFDFGNSILLSLRSVLTQRDSNISFNSNSLSATLGSHNNMTGSHSFSFDSFDKIANAR